MAKTNKINIVTLEQVQHPECWCNGYDINYGGLIVPEGVFSKMTFDKAVELIKKGGNK